MKKQVCLLSLLLIASIFTACTDAPSDSSSAPASKTIQFADAAFETKVKKALGKDVITEADAAAVKELDLSNEGFDAMNNNPDQVIKDLGDIRYFKTLESLNISYNNIADLSPLSQVTSLTQLGLTGVRANDYSPLKTLVNMRYITMQWIYAEGSESSAQLESLDILSGMKELEAVDFKGCGLKDISALGSLSTVWSVFLTDNLITDVSPLANLTKLKELELSKNPITDFSLLKDIYDKLEYKDFKIK